MGGDGIPSERPAGVESREDSNPVPVAAPVATEAPHPNRKRSVLFKCLVVQGKPDELRRLHPHWQLMPSNLAATDPESTDETLNDRRAASSGEHWGASQVVVRRSRPIQFAVLNRKDRAEFDAAIRDAQESRKCEVLSRPQLTTIDGRPGSIHVGTRRSYLVGFNQSDEPQVRVFELGLRARLRPTIKGSAIRLEYALSHDQIRGFNATKVRRTNDESITLNIPTELETTSIHGVNEIPNGKTLLVLAEVGQTDTRNNALLFMISPLMPHEGDVAAIDGRSTHNNAEEYIPWGLLQRTPPRKALLAAGDVLGVYVSGVLGDESPPVQLPNASNVAPSLGFPIPVRSNGTISLPLIEDPVIAGLTLEQAQQRIRAAYTNQKIVNPNSTIIVTMVRPKHIGVLVVRRDVPTRRRLMFQNEVSHKVHPVDTADVKDAIQIKLVATEADILSALAATGGLPGLEVREVLVYRKRDPDSPKRIPILVSQGEAPNLTEDDVTLLEGDIVVVAPVGRTTEVSSRPTSPSIATYEPETDDRVLPSAKYKDPFANKMRWQLSLQECVSRGPTKFRAASLDGGTWCHCAHTGNEAALEA